jgi:hypothetical protein
MTTRPPPVPPQNRSDKAPEDKTAVPTDTSKDRDPAPNLEQQGRHGNIKQNTTHQGLRQAR